MPPTLCPLTVIQLAGGPAPTFCIFVFVHDTWSPNLTDSCSTLSSALEVILLITNYHTHHTPHTQTILQLSGLRPGQPR